MIASAERLEFELVIRRAAVVTGTVRDDRGTAVANAIVQFLRPFDEDHSHLSRPLMRSLTEADGTYRVDGLPPGSYLAAAMPTSQPIGIGTDASTVRGLAAQFYPGVASRQGALELRVRPNAEIPGVDFVLPRLPLANITGRLIPPPGVTLQQDYQAIVTGAEDAPPSWAAARVLSDGRFIISVSPGRYRIDVRAVGRQTDEQHERAGRVYYSSAIVDVQDSLQAQPQFRLVEGVQVSGRIRPVGPGANEVEVKLVPVSAGQPAVRPVQAAGAADWRFTVDGVAPARYFVELIDAGSSWALDSVRFNGTRRPDLTIDVRDQVGVEEFEVGLVPTTSSLAGRVIGTGQSASTYVVALIPWDGAGKDVAGSKALVRLARPDNKGAYLFSRQRPGAYLVLLLSNPSSPDISHSTLVELAHAHAASTISVVLDVGNETKLDVRVK